MLDGETWSESAIGGKGGPMLLDNTPGDEDSVCREMLGSELLYLGQYGRTIHISQARSKHTVLVGRTGVKCW